LVACTSLYYYQTVAPLGLALEFVYKLKHFSEVP
jgi:hypothetical protein